jgi:hypothetical protein
LPHVIGTPLLSKYKPRHLKIRKKEVKEEASNRSKAMFKTVDSIWGFRKDCGTVSVVL